MRIASVIGDEVREMFDRIVEEFCRLMLDMDHAKSKTELRAGFNSIDTNHDGRVSFDEFCAWVIG